MLLCQSFFFGHRRLAVDSSYHNFSTWIKYFFYLYLLLFAAMLAYGTDMLPRIAQLNSAKKLHNYLINNLFRVPIKFHETVPTGRILSRVSKDIEVLDFTMPETVFWWMYCFWEVMQNFCPCFVLNLTMCMISDRWLTNFTCNLEWF